MTKTTRIVCLCILGASRLLNASDPNSRFYIGTNIQFAEYHTSKDEYKCKNKEAIKRFSKKKILVLGDGISKIFNT